MKRKPKKIFIIFFFGFVIGLVGFITSFVMHQKKELLPENLGDQNYVDLDKAIVNSLTLKVDNKLNLDMMPTLDKFGIENEAFSFSIRNITSKPLSFVLSLVDDNSTIKNHDVRYQIIKNKEVIGIYTLGDDGIIDIDEIKGNEEINYQLRMWLNYESKVKIGKLSKKIGLKEETRELDNSHAAIPALVSGMIPVYYDEDKMAFCKSDTNNSFYHEWYNYEHGKWANAVTVDVSVRNTYMESSVGTEIRMEDINSMWVWIPRLNYQLNNNNVLINFVDTNTDAYSSFNFNNQVLSGFWVSKFEAGIREDSECNTTSITNKCNNSNNTLYFKPNMLMMNKITMANLFYNIRKMELKNNIYGFLGNGSKLNSDGTIYKDNNNIDIHMIKNSEWETISILAKSLYGAKEEISLNPKNITGYSLIDNEIYPFDIKNKGVKASTTGNIYGVYDMVGGKREYVMVNHLNGELFTKKSNSGFTSKVKDYYYDDGMDELTKALENKYQDSYLLSNEPVSRGGYKSIQSNLFGLYGVSDYINRISNETNTRAVISVWKGNE